MMWVCEMVVRMLVWVFGVSGGENVLMGFECVVTYEKFRALFVERAFERRGKWCEKIMSVCVMLVEVLKDFDWCVCGMMGGVGVVMGLILVANASTCRFAFRLRRGGVSVVVVV